MSEPAQLSNQGGLFTLLDAAGLKIAGVAYTGGQGAPGGWTLTFWRGRRLPHPSRQPLG